MKNKYLIEVSNICPAITLTSKECISCIMTLGWKEKVLRMQKIVLMSWTLDEQR